ncbi:MAG: hypothetical protein M1812_006415 [Candelaria pacifica]|nr:MAG: hypothetical protein M1812_006415 [Candelaria pacifica]
MRHTDLYLTRSYSLMQKRLHPDTIFFLGDLFDGGREWATEGEKSHSPEERYRRYGQKFWLREFQRFGRIFFDHWGDGGMEAGQGQRGRRMIASLPGNHDLGLGVGIQKPVRDRFGAYFGESNRVDVVGNHTFVSVDTVSLSAMSQADPSTGSQGAGESSGPKTEHENIWMPVEEFLNGAKAAKRRAVGREIRFLGGKVEDLRHEHAIAQMRDTRLRLGSLDAGEGSAEFPTILLTHVPLYRPPGTPCGPKREHWPPSVAQAKGQPLENDERNAIAVRAGYQYQNVLTPEISKLLVEKIGNVAHVFSGDDHDYCEVIHKGYTAGTAGGGGLLEITVKSISWAMGVRKPGFSMLSLWNPVDEVGNPISAKGERLTESEATVDANGTMQSHLCLLPDQLGIFLRYALFLGLTILALAVRAALIVSSGGEGGLLSSQAGDYDKEGPLLPITRSREGSSSAEEEKAAYANHPSQPDHSDQDGSQGLNSSLAAHPSDGLSVRTNNRPRSRSPGGYGYALSTSHSPSPPAASSMGNFQPANDGAVSSVGGGEWAKESKRRRGGRIRVMSLELARSLWRVGSVALIWYLWLVWRG